MSLLSSSGELRKKTQSTGHKQAYTGCGNKLSLKGFAIFSAIARKFKVKFYTFITCSS